jgi:hypothetical protein
MLYTFSNLNRFDNLTHVITSARYENNENFNIADHVGPETQNALRNRKIVCDRLGFNFARLTAAQQVHNPGVTLITAENAGSGSDGWDSAIPETDALITSLTDTPLMVISADCPLILLYDRETPAIGVIHASWRCLFGGIIEKTVRLMTQHLSTSPQTLYAGIGPGAGPCCYEIDDHFIQTISARPELLPFVLKKGEQKFFDLFAAGRSELVHASLPVENIEVMGLCTICDENFFSYRRQGSAAGRFALIAALG